MVMFKQTSSRNFKSLNSNEISFGIKKIGGANTVSPCAHPVKIVVFTTLCCKNLTISLVPLYSIDRFNFFKFNYNIVQTPTRGICI